MSGGNMLIVDSRGILSSTRPDMEKLSSANPWKAASEENQPGKHGGKC
ncbi:MAG: hypothetical protein ACP5PQ_00380 [Thermoproteota archaeon]